MYTLSLAVHDTATTYRYKAVNARSLAVHATTTTCRYKAVNTMSLVVHAKSQNAGTMQ